MGEQVVGPFRPGVAAADGEQAVGGFLPAARGGARGVGGAGVGVAEALQGGAVGGVVVPDGELEEDGAQGEEDLGLVFVREVGLVRVDVSDEVRVFFFF